MPRVNLSQLSSFLPSMACSVLKVEPADMIACKDIIETLALYHMESPTSQYFVLYHIESPPPSQFVLYHLESPGF